MWSHNIIVAGDHGATVLFGRFLNAQRTGRRARGSARTGQEFGFSFLQLSPREKRKEEDCAQHDSLEHDAVRRGPGRAEGPGKCRTIGNIMVHI